MGLSNIIEVNNSYLMLYVQDVKTDTKEELTKILEFLGLIIDERRLKCVEQNQQTKLKRKGFEKDFNPFKGELPELVDSYIDKADALVKQRNSEGLPLKKYTFYRNSVKNKTTQSFMRGSKVSCDEEAKLTFSLSQNKDSSHAVDRDQSSERTYLLM